MIKKKMATLPEKKKLAKKNDLHHDFLIFILYDRHGTCDPDTVTEYIYVWTLF